jgi:hypothetical protein
VRLGAAVEQREEVLLACAQRRCSPALRDKKDLCRTTYESDQIDVDTGDPSRRGRLFKLRCDPRLECGAL